MCQNLAKICMEFSLHNNMLYFILKAVILEGRYWRRKLEAVAREYKKLRIYYKKVGVMIKKPHC